MREISLQDQMASRQRYLGRHRKGGDDDLMSSMGKRMERRGSELVRKLDEVEGGGAHDAFSRARG
jgi:hypothetical protein